MTWILLILLILVVITWVARHYASKAYKQAVTNDDGRDRDVGRDEKMARQWATGIGTGLSVLFVLLFAFSTITIIPETQAGVPVTFGKVGSTLNTGVNFVAPWTNVYTFPTRPVTIELAGEESIYARTADSGQIKAEVAVRWKVDKEKAPDLYRQVRTGSDTKISETVVEKNLRQAVGEVYTTYTNLDATSGDRGVAAQKIKETLQEQLDRYGIIIEDVNLRSVEPDEATATVLGRLAQEKQNTETARQQARTAEEQANTQRIQAQAQADAAAILAQIPADALTAQCIAIVRESVQKGVPLYVNPCGGGGVAGVIVGK